jgi:hypothetical protein
MARLFQDDLPRISVCPLRRNGFITRETQVYHLSLAGVEAYVRIEHRDFPRGGQWTHFVCPSCARRARILNVHQGRFRCGYCVKLGYRSQTGGASKAHAIERLKARAARRRGAVNRPALLAHIERLEIYERLRSLGM